MQYPNLLIVCPLQGDIVPSKEIIHEVIAQYTITQSESSSQHRSGPGNNKNILHAPSLSQPTKHILSSSNDGSNKTIVRQGNQNTRPHNHSNSPLLSVSHTRRNPGGVHIGNGDQSISSTATNHSISIGEPSMRAKQKQHPVRVHSTSTHTSKAASPASTTTVSGTYQNVLNKRMTPIRQRVTPHSTGIIPKSNDIHSASTCTYVRTQSATVRLHVSPFPSKSNSTHPKQYITSLLSPSDQRRRSVITDETSSNKLNTSEKPYQNMTIETADSNNDSQQVQKIYNKRSVSPFLTALALRRSASTTAICTAPILPGTAAVEKTKNEQMEQDMTGTHKNALIEVYVQNEIQEQKFRSQSVSAHQHNDSLATPLEHKFVPMPYTQKKC